MFEERKKWTSLIACRAWKLKAMGRNRDKGKRSLYLGEEDVKRILLDCLRTTN
jgi:hypothetical protein